MAPFMVFVETIHSITLTTTDVQSLISASAGYHVTLESQPMRLNIYIGPGKILQNYRERFVANLN